MSRPEHSWKAPSTSASPAGCRVGSRSSPDTTNGERKRLTLKLNAWARTTRSGTAPLHSQSSVSLPKDAQDEELERLGRRHAHLDDQLALVADPCGIERLVGSNIEGLALVGPLERARREE